MIRDTDRLRRWHDRLADLGIDSPLSHPLCFKKELHIGAAAYRSLTIKKRVLALVRPIGAAGVGASVAGSSAVATTFFPAGILGALGLATAATPIGWVIGTAVFSGAAWTFVSRKLDDLSSNRVVEIPKFINTPLDLLGRQYLRSGRLAGSKAGDGRWWIPRARTDQNHPVLR